MSWMETILCSVCNTMDKETYLSDPCGASSLPLWKTNSIHIPNGLQILREDDPRFSLFSQDHIDTPYFKTIHHMRHIAPPGLPDGFRFICPDAKTLSDHIASCYLAERATEAEITAYRRHPTFCPDLWLAIYDEQIQQIIASGIAEVDDHIREGILEWIQVSPAFRCRGWGRCIVNELLYRMIGRADFVTVSGKVNDPLDPMALYESCGFENRVTWHVLRKE